MSDETILCVGGPRDGERIAFPIDSKEWQDRQFFAIDENFETVSYWIHRLQGQNQSSHWVALLAEQRNVIEQLIAGYQATKPEPKRRAEIIPSGSLFMIKDRLSNAMLLKSGKWHYDGVGVLLSDCAFASYHDAEQFIQKNAAICGN